MSLRHTNLRVSCCLTNLKVFTYWLYRVCCSDGRSMLQSLKESITVIRGALTSDLSLVFATTCGYIFTPQDYGAWSSHDLCLSWHFHHNLSILVVTTLRIYIYTYIHIYMHMYIYMCVCVCICTYLYMYMQRPYLLSFRSAWNIEMYPYERKMDPYQLVEGAFIFILKYTLQKKL